jgi:hypothetical protein
MNIDILHRQRMSCCFRAIILMLVVAGLGVDLGLTLPDLMTQVEDSV